MNWTQRLGLAGLAVCLFLGTATIALSAQGRLQSTLNRWFGDPAEEFASPGSNDPSPQDSVPDAQDEGDALPNIPTQPAPAGDLINAGRSSDLRDPVIRSTDDLRNLLDEPGQDFETGGPAWTAVELDQIATALQERTRVIEAREAALGEREQDLQMMMAEVDERLRSAQREHVEVAQARQELQRKFDEFQAQIHIVRPEDLDQSLGGTYQSLLRFHKRYGGNTITEHVRQQWNGTDRERSRIIHLRAVLDASERSDLLGAIDDPDLVNEILGEWVRVLVPSQTATGR